MGTDRAVVNVGSMQTVTDYGVTSIVDLILGDSNTTEHMRGANAQIEIVRVDADGNAMSNLVIASPHADTDGVVTTSDPDDYTARIDWEWRDTSGDVYTSQSGKVYKAAPAADEDILSASSWTLEAGETDAAKAADKVLKAQWSLTLQHQQSPSTQPSATLAEIEAGLKAFADPIVDSSAATVTGSTIYAFLDTNESSTPLRLSDPIHDGTTDWTISTSLSRDRTNHPHQFTVALSADGPVGPTAVTGVYLGVGSITDNPRKIIYGRRIALSISGQYNASYTFQFQDA